MFIKCKKIFSCTIICVILLSTVTISLVQADDNKIILGDILKEDLTDNNILLSGNEIVNIPDSGLQNAIRSILKKPTGDILRSDLEGISGSINISSYNINNLSGIEFCVNVTSLDLSSNNISDISLISSLNKLESLDLSNNKISDISLLRYNTNLTRLSLRNNKISDISYLSYLSRLYSLDLRANNVVDISSLTNLTSMTYLVLASNYVNDISPLKKLTKLTDLILDNNEITDISVLSDFTKLSNLFLYNNYIDVSKGSKSREIIDKLKSLNSKTYITFAEGGYYQYIIKNSSSDHVMLEPNDTYVPVIHRFLTQDGVTFKLGSEYEIPLNYLTFTSSDINVIDVDGNNKLAAKTFGGTLINIFYKGIVGPIIVKIDVTEKYSPKGPNITYTNNLLEIKDFGDVTQIDQIIISEDFEDTDFKIPFYFYGDLINWSTTTSQYKNGKSSFTNPILNNLQNTAFEFSVEIPQNNDSSPNFTFDYLLQSREDFDYFTVYVNETKVLEKTGETSWVNFKYTLPKGKNTVRFEYFKKSFDSGNLNSVFIDNLNLHCNGAVTVPSTGIKEIQYNINNGEWQTYTSPNVSLKHGDTVTARVIDNAGNMSKNTSFKYITSATDFENHFGVKEIKYAMNNNWVNTTDTFRPNDAITRAEFIKIVNKAFGLTSKVTSEPFKDVEPTEWWYNEVLIALKNGYISTSNSNFRPRDPITREEVANIITTITKTKDRNLDKLNKYKDKHLISPSMLSSVEGAIEKEYMGVNSTMFNPKKNITRGEAIVTLFRVVN